MPLIPTECIGLTESQALRLAYLRNARMRTVRRDDVPVLCPARDRDGLRINLTVVKGNVTDAKYG